MKSGADLKQIADDPDAGSEDLAGDGARRHPRGGLAGARPAAAPVVAHPILRIVGEVGVTRPVGVLDLAIVLRALILVADHQGHGRAGGDALEHAGEDLDAVRLAALGGEPGLARLAPVEPMLDLGRLERDAGRHAVDHDADRRPVALAPGREPEQLAEGGACHQAYVGDKSAIS